MTSPNLPEVENTALDTNAATRRKFLGTLGAVAAGASVAQAASAQDQSAQVGQMSPNAGVQNSLAGNDPLRGKVAIVTGARANIGRGCAIGLAQLGADIVVHYHRESTKAQAEETGRMCREAGARRVAYAQGDLGKEAVVKRMFDTAQNRLGGADILVNNAGAIVKKPIAEVSAEEYQRCYNINEWGTFLCMREAANRLNDDGRIINIVTSIVPSITPNYGAYAATKAGNNQLVKTLSAEIGGEDRRITVNSVHPGPIDTPFFRLPESEGAIAYATEMANLNRLGRVSDVVPLVQFLALPSTQWITGESLYVNGGYTQA